MKATIRHLLAWLLCATTLYACQENFSSSLAGQQPATGRQNSPVTMFLRLFDLLDSDGDGVVPLARVFDRLDLKQAEARQVKRARALDGNNDGQITRAEAIAGVLAEIAYQGKRRMNTDVNEDGELTLTEYSLAIADPNGKADASGFTALQLSAFNYDDLNNDGKVMREEVETRLSEAYAESYWALLMAVRARQADGNRDGRIDEQEWAQIESGSDPEASRKRFTAAGAKDGKLSVQNLQLLFLRIPIQERDAAETRMNIFEERLKPRSSEKTQK